MINSQFWKTVAKQWASSLDTSAIKVTGEKAKKTAEETIGEGNIDLLNPLSILGDFEKE